MSPALPSYKTKDIKPKDIKSKIRKLLTNNSIYFTCKQSCQNFSQFNSQVYQSSNLSRSIGVYYKFAELLNIQKSKQFTTVTKLYAHFNRCRKIMWQTSIVTHIKKKLEIEENFLDLIKGVYKKPKANIIFND